MYRFFVEEGQLNQREIMLSAQDYNHIHNVLRMKVGDEVLLCDGGDKEEYIMLRLRLKEGLNLNELTRIYGEDATKNIKEKAPLLKEQGFVNFENNIISLTEKGFLISNTIISELI